MAYAAITSLMTTISLSLGHQSRLTQVDKELIKVLYGKLDSLRTLVEETDTVIRDGEALKSLEGKTAKLVYAAEDTLESELTELDLYEIEGPICECLQQLVVNVDSTAEEWMKMRNMYSKINDLKPQTYDLGYSSQHVLESMSIMVGYDDELELMKEQLVRGLREVKVISLVGMGGIGKTTFAIKIFSDPVVMSHFDVRAKVTVSQEYQMRNLYLGLLRYTSSRSEGLDKKNDGELADLLQKSLKGKRYLVIIDDVWTTQAWDDVMICFPFQNNGSRILLTTRNAEVAEYASLGAPPYQMRLLTFDECWSLLCNKVFANECLTPEFEQMGNKIARKCQGLPLAIVVIAGVLLKLGKSLDEWKRVVEDVNTLKSTDLNQYCSRVLALSYYHLPHHLRACLLYLVAFKKSSVIQVSKLVKLWAAEGFVKVKSNESFETVVQKCLKDLIDRSLVSVKTWSSCGKLKSCGIHDMIHGFCLEEAQRTNFLSIATDKDTHFPSNQRRVSIHSEMLDYYHLPFGDNADAQVRSIIYCGSRIYTKVLAISCFKLLRVLDIIPLRFDYKPHNLEGLVHLRYLAFTIYKPSSTLIIPNLKNLQSLIIHSVEPPRNIFYDSLCVPKEIWGMLQLRHLKSSLINLVDPPPENKSLVLERLHTLSGLNPACCTPLVLQGISNVKRLKFYGTKNGYMTSRLGRLEYYDLSHFHQLKSLSVAVMENILVGEIDVILHLPPASAFPQNLKKLTLQNTLLPWEEMRTVSKLPKLEVLKLKEYACEGTEWETTEDGFPQLKFLLLQGTYLASWKTTSDHFPCLERLFLKNCHSLVSIPEDFAYITTLQLIELNRSKSSVVASAKQIQQEAGDNILYVRVSKGLSKDEARKRALQHWLEAIDPRHRYGQNLHIYYTKWLQAFSEQPFFYWLDIGEGREINLERCPRSKLQQECIKYLGPKEREAYEVVIVDGKLLYKQSERVVDTREGPKDAKWIFVLSNSKILYIGMKQKGTFHHSSFLANGETLSAGRLVVEDGILKVAWLKSGRYLPTEQNYEAFMLFLKQHNVDVAVVQSEEYEDDREEIPSEEEDDDE